MKIYFMYILIVFLIFSGCATMSEEEKEDYVGVKLVEINPEELAKRTKYSVEYLEEMKDKGFHYYNEENDLFVAKTSGKHEQLQVILANIADNDGLEVYPNPTSSFVTISFEKNIASFMEKFFPLYFKYDLIFDEKIIHSYENPNFYGKETISDYILQKPGVYRIACNIAGFELLKSFMVVKK